MRRWTGLLSTIAVAAVALAAAVPASARDRDDDRHDQRRIAREYHDLQRQRAELGRAYA
ncbi:hypothetical protein [Oleisolibacter albus]|uniref:hypothetical protein n=1 Tax=Oleisolibacter albus TaxID=2171757 RepID=UPI0012D7D700|nr:hypothetical protein [Oleisolibacter albus]